MTPSTSSLQPQEKGINLQIKLMIREVNLPKNRTAREKLYWEGMRWWAAMGKSKDLRQESTA